LPKKFFFYPAQFWTHKNHLRLIEAVARLLPEMPDIHLVLCGSKKNAFDAVSRRIHDFGIWNQVTVIDFIPDEDLPAIYRRARALVMPTFFGPTNIPPLEAFEYGCPVAISNIYGIPEQVQGAALLFDPRSVDELVDCMRRLWRDDSLCERLRGDGLKRAAKWGPAQFNARFLEIIREVLGPGQGHPASPESVLP